MEFIISNHAKKRIFERKLFLPSEINLVLTKNKIKKRVREICKKNGFSSSLIYWRSNEKQPVIYVCEIIDIATYKVITAFRLEN
ncbi:DUF4258 domain-containing protein [Flavobacterium sp.]|uniref:DUF4258 domain-containing protein n=1 Tax=Flavobacterium sp. TaxID=239 RepID=UPI00374D2899